MTDYIHARDRHGDLLYLDETGELRPVPPHQEPYVPDGWQPLMVAAEPGPAAVVTLAELRELRGCGL